MHGGRKVEGIMIDRQIYRMLKWTVLDSCVVPSSTYGLETLAFSELPRKSTAKMEGLSIGASKKSRGGRTMQIKGQQQGERKKKVAYIYE